MHAMCRAITWVLLVSLLVLGCGAVEPPSVETPGTDTPSTPLMTTVSPTATSALPAATSIPAAATQTEAPILRQSTFELYSDHVADRYKIYIRLPEGYDPQHPEGYPVIYLLDGDWYFDGQGWRISGGGVAGIVSSLGRGGRIPKAILVGIGYVEENQRGRDFLWRYEKFYAFLTEELIPFIDANYRTDLGSERTLVGHSDGGYFTLYSFCQYEGNGANPFGRFIAISGDFTKNEWLMFREEGKLNRRIGDGGVVKGALFMAVGGQEEARFVTSNQDMVNRLESRHYEGLRFKSKTYRSDDHMSVVTPAVWAGLMWVFGE
jgi:enterochelin esterase-like enzyme